MAAGSKTQLMGGLIAAAAAVSAIPLLIAGWIGGEPARLAIQTLPLWVVVAFGWAGGGYGRWAGFPILLFWGALCALIWLDRLGVLHFAGGSYSSIEARVAAIVAVACVVGLGACVGPHERTSPLTGLTLALACGALQIGAFYFGMQPKIF